MKYKRVAILIMTGFLGISSISLAIEKPTIQNAPNLLSLETFVVEPLSVTTISIWVPADKIGPMINRCCQDREHNLYKCQLPADVVHTKTINCPSGLARLLAEYVWPNYKDNLPLTIFNGWEWEFAYSLSQHEAVEYKLPKRGGAWENMVEAVFNQTLGYVWGCWVSLNPSNQISSGEDNLKSNIEVRSFSSLRSRNGYPKQCQLR